MASAAVADNFTSRDDQKRQAQLREARASGQAAPEIDSSTGNMINPHNPQFITQAPWYLNQNKPSLKHQQAWNLKSSATKDWYQRGTKGDVKTKFLKGACTNCGARTHTKKDCVERPRQVGAKWNGLNLMPDEYINDLALDYEGKHDRWNGYSADDYKEVIEEWEKVENERRRRKALEMEERAKLKERLKAQKRALKKKRKMRRKQLRRAAAGKNSDGTDTDTGTDGDSDMMDSDTDTDTDSDSDASDDEDLGEKLKDFDRTTAAVATKDDKLRTTTRNLRIREDTAKYLLNLDVNSAFYDPKSRSMRANPLGHLKEEEQGAYRGDNYVRTAGDSKQLTELMVFAWDAYKNGEKIHDVAQPTQALKMHQIYKNRSKDLRETQQNELLDKYGGAEHLEAPQDMLFGQNDTYVEYSRDGRVLKGRERALQKSKYEEDILTGNHASIWGSWYNTQTSRFGYKCCQQCLRNAYCVPIKKGEALANVEKEGVQTVDADASAPAASSQMALDNGKSSDSDPSSSSASDSSGSNEAKKAQKAQRQAAKDSAKTEKDEKRKARALHGLKLYGKQSESRPATDAPEAESKLSDKRSSAFGHVLEDVKDLDQKKLDNAVQQAKKKQKLEKRTVSDVGMSLEEERKRGYNSFGGDKEDLSPEEYEAYKLTRARAEDPMAKFL